MEDVVIAWALYELLAPVNRSLSLLTAWFRLVRDRRARGLDEPFRGLSDRDDARVVTLFGQGPLRAQIALLLPTFRYDWSYGLIVFGIHLCLLGYLIFRSTISRGSSVRSSLSMVLD